MKCASVKLKCAAEILIPPAPSAGRLLSAGGCSRSSCNGRAFVVRAAALLGSSRARRSSETGARFVRRLLWQSFGKISFDSVEQPVTSV